MNLDPKRIDELVNHKLIYNTSRRIREILSQSTSTTCEKYVGCSLDKFKIHLEKTMTDGMTWNNYGKSRKCVWHMDHIIPCSAFNLQNPIEKQACFYYKNVRACWWDENIAKKNYYKQEDKDRYLKWFVEVVLNI